jgi:putative phosphoesterase
VRILVLADTHIKDAGSRTLPDPVVAAARSADLILHAGDVVGRALLRQLEQLGPVRAVLGNNDHGLADELPETQTIECDGVTIAMVHDSGATKGRAARLRRRFPTADLVVFGHSHMPVDETGVDGQRLFNPGSCTERRRAPHRTYGELDVRAGAIVAHRIVPIDP